MMRIEVYSFFELVLITLFLVVVWYFEKADGSYTVGEKTLYWYGIQDLDDIQHFINANLSGIASSSITTPQPTW